MYCSCLRRHNSSREVLTASASHSAAACGVITLKVIMNDTIRSEEDVGKYLGMSVLASVPDDDGMAKEQQRNRSKRKLERKKRKTEKNRRGE